MNASARNKVLVMVSQLIQENENIPFWDQKNFMEYFFDRLQSTIDYNDLWQNIENNIKKVSDLTKKNFSIAEANLYEVEYLRFEQNQKQADEEESTDDENEDDTDNGSNISNNIMNLLNEVKLIIKNSLIFF